MTIKKPCRWARDEGNQGEEIVRCQTCGVHRGNTCLAPSAVVLDNELLLAAKEVLANGHQHDVGGGDVFIGTCDSTERLQRAVDARVVSSQATATQAAAEIVRQEANLPNGTTQTLVAAFVLEPGKQLPHGAKLYAQAERALTEERLQEICDEVETRYNMGGLSDGLYGDYAKDVARHAVSAVPKPKLPDPLAVPAETFGLSRRYALGWNDCLDAMTAAQPASDDTK